MSARCAIIFAWLAAVLSAGPALGADPEAGRQKARMCAACHDERGVSLRPDAPHLSGQIEMYLAAQLRAYRSGERKSEVMKVIAGPLSDEDIDDLAAWYASVRVVVEPEEEKGKE